MNKWLIPVLSLLIINSSVGVLIFGKVGFVNILPTSTCGNGWERGENIALNKPAKGYNLVDDYDNPSFANDGIKYDEDRVVALGRVPSLEAWIEIELGDTYYIYEVKLIIKRLWAPIDKKQSSVKLLFFNNKRGWYTIWSKNDLPNGLREEIDIPCIGNKTSRIKLLKTKSSGLLEDILVVYEIEVYEARDVLAPDTEIIKGPKDGDIVNRGSIEFRWRGIDNEPEEDLYYQYRLYLNGGHVGWTNTKEKTIAFVLSDDIKDDGKYIFEVRAVDSFGNIDPTPARREFYVDITPPSVNIISPEPGYLYVFGRKILHIAVNGDYAVMIGSSCIDAEVENLGSELIKADLLLDGLPVNSKRLWGYSTTVSFPVYNGFHLYEVVAYSKINDSGSDSIKIKGFTGRNPPGCSENKTNAPPYQLTRPIGPSEGRVNTIYKFSCKAEDLEKEDIYYMFAWGDGTNSGWLGPYKSGETVEVFHSWKKEGAYEIKVFVKDSKGNQGEWYSSTTIKISDEKKYKEDIDADQVKKEVSISGRLKRLSLRIHSSKIGIMTIFKDIKILDGMAISSKNFKVRTIENFNLKKTSN